MKNKSICQYICAVSLVTALTFCKKDKNDPPHKIGDDFEGGKVAYILQPGDANYDASKQHGLIAAPADQNGGNFIDWSTTVSNVATSVNIGTGKTNTDAIVQAFPSAKSAANVCANLTLNGYDDWYLPSREELLKIYDKKDSVGGFAPGKYWSSSQLDVNQAWTVRLDIGIIVAHEKYNTTLMRVRAVRSF